MLGIEGRATRTTAVTAVFLAVLMLGLPSFNLGNQQMSVSPVENAAAVAGDRVLTIGWPDFTTTIATLNPLMYITESERMTIWPCYNSLFTRDIDGKMIGDLVTSYGVSQDGKTWDFNLVHTARFYDKNAPTVEHNLTASDVIYTFWLVQNTSGNHLQSNFPVVKGQPIIQNMWTPAGDSYHLYIRLSTAYAPFINALASIPILPEYVWSTQVWNWDNFRTREPVYAPIIGSGPFYYMLVGIPSTGVVELGRSPTWFATEEKGWQLHINKLVIKTSTDPQLLIEDYLDGLYDIIVFVPPREFNSSLPGSRFAVSSGLVYEYNLNQMSDTLRATYPALRPGSNNQLLLDPIVKKAMAMMVDKQRFIDGVLNGLGTVADSLCPDVNPWHYTYPNPIQFSTSKARQDLWNAGWQFDTNGNQISANSTAYPVCKAGGMYPLRFRFCTLDTSPEWDIGGRLIATWAAQGGVDLWRDYKVQSTAFMNAAWANADYDTWLWDWRFSPTSEISTDVMQLLTTEAIGSWSDVFYSNKMYDDTYNASLVEINPDLRKVLTDKLQALAYEDMGCQLIAYGKDLYAASSLGPDHWGSYGDWQTQYALKPDQLYPWLYMQIEPADNHAPTITGFQTEYETSTTTNTPMTGSAIDAQGGVEYKWFFGDGNTTGWLSNPSVTHMYTRDAYYTAYLAVRELIGPDHFVTWKAASVRVLGFDPPPCNLSFTYEPSDPNTGDIVYFNGSATDDSDEQLAYSWSFGDLWRAYGQNVTHQFIGGANSYTVTMSVDDGHFGSVPRPATYVRTISVTLNSPPSITVPDVIGVSRYDLNTYPITSTDPDARDTVRYTWDWGDGSPLQVTSTKFAAHAYTNRSGNIFTMTVYADDLTGLPGHNVSDQGWIGIDCTPHRPEITLFVKNIENVVTGQEVMFIGTVRDANNDLCLVRFDFGDGTNISLFQSAPNTTLYANHIYSAGGPMSAYLYASDGVLTNQSSAMDFVVGTAFTLNLATGWNLVTVPRVGFGYKASTLGLNSGDTVAEWNSSTRTYRSHIVGVPVNDFVIAPSTGYWINVPNGTRTLTLYGYIPNTTQSRNITVPPGGGWVLIGFVGLNATRHARDVPAMYSVPNGIQLVARWNPIWSTYSNWISSIPLVNDYLLIPGQAYWALCSASGVFSYLP